MQDIERLGKEYNFGNIAPTDDIENAGSMFFDKWNRRL
jgi:hypothetical protein